MNNTKKKSDKPSKGRKKSVLGKGLGALIPEIESIDNLPPTGSERDFFNCPVELIEPNPYQPRITFSESELGELAESIRSQGVLQPLLVRKNDTGYELIAGERRLRAAKQAGLDDVPVMVKNISDRKMLEISIVENIQRQNLNPVEEAESYHRLMTEFDLTQEEAAERVGKSRSAVANIIRLRQLPGEIKESITAGAISMGHARALLGADNEKQQFGAWQEVIGRELSVRETEKLIRDLKQEKKENPPKVLSPEDHYFSDLSDSLSQRYGTKVQIRKKGKKGKVVIDFYSPEDLDRLITLLQGTT